MIFRSNDQINTTAFILTFDSISVPNYLQKHPYFVFASKKLFFSGKKFDIQILLITFKRHHRRYENRLFNVISRLRTELSTKTPKIRFASKQLFILAKKLIFKFCLLLSRGTIGGMKTVYFIVLSRLSTELSTKNIQISFC